MPKYSSPYGPNTYLSSSHVNLTIKELHQMDEARFEAWSKELKKEVVYAWDELGIPVIGGREEDAIIREFQKLVDYDVSAFSVRDEISGNLDCIENTSGLGSGCNQFFPTMLKTKDISSKSLSGVSIYSYFSDEKLHQQYLRELQKMIYRDPLNYFSKLVEKRTESASDWVKKYKPKNDEDIWVSYVRDPKKGYLHLTSKEVCQLADEGFLRSEQIKGSGDYFHIRKFNPNDQILKYSKMFRLSFGGTPATNFPPLTAKFLYLKYTEKIKDQSEIVIYDPSSGWGGRILGAMASCHDRNLHYVGTDPNSDHWMDDLGMTKYEYLAKYFSGNVRAKRQNTFEIFRSGSEEIHNEKAFQKYKGKIDFVFTSPPYFAAEGYSDEETQSHIKFPTYDAWRDGFLQRTLQTCSEWLRGGRFLCLNVADVRFNGKVLPIQEDAKKILLKLGLGYHGDLKMVLKDAPAVAAQTSDGIPLTRNFCQIAGVKRKYEPILVFQKFNDDADMIDKLYEQLHGR